MVSGVVAAVVEGKVVGVGAEEMERAQGVETPEVGEEAVGGSGVVARARAKVVVRSGAAMATGAAMAAVGTMVETEM